MMSVSTLVDEGGEESLSKRTPFTHTFFVLNKECYIFHFTNVRTRVLEQNLQRKGLKLVLSIGDPSRPLSTKVDTDVIHMIRWTRPSPSVFAYCKRSKTGWWEGLGMRLDICYFSYLQAYTERGFFKFTYGARDSLVEFLHADNFCQAHIKAAETCTLPESPVVREGGRAGLLYRAQQQYF